MNENGFTRSAELADDDVVTLRDFGYDSPPDPEDSAPRAPTGGARAQVDGIHRKVLAEITEGRHEPTLAARIALHFAPGSPEFNEAYLESRCRQFRSGARPDPSSCVGDSRFVRNAVSAARGGPPSSWMERNPWVLRRLRDVFGIFGLNAILWIMLQATAGAVTVWSGSPLPENFRAFASFGGPAALLFADWQLWRRIRGRFFSEAVAPAFWVICGSLVLALAAAACRLLFAGVGGLPG